MIKYSPALSMGIQDSASRINGAAQVKKNQNSAK
jgi:hypothetical protein